MTTPADSELLGWDTSGGQPRLTVRGDWTLDNYVALGEQIARLQRRNRGFDRGAG